jgi:CheY-like chemotaxis protein
MKTRALLGLGLVGCGLWVAGDAFACGDKLVIVGRGIRPASVKALRHRASILVYAAPGGALPAALTEGGLQRNLERAGHRLSRVATEGELNQALAKGGFDLVFADLRLAPRVEAEARKAPARPTVLPTLYNPSPAELAAARSQFQCVLTSPGTEKDYLAVIDEALEARAREARAEKKR